MQSVKSVEIKNRFTGEVICTGETLQAAVESNLANLGGADLGGANLRGANLGGADLGGANLGGADLRGAYLGGGESRAKIAWQSHDLIAEILRRAAGDDVAKLKVAGFILVCLDKCWSDFLKMRDPLAGWALEVLRPWAEGDENAPMCLISKEPVQ